MLQTGGLRLTLASFSPYPCPWRPGVLIHEAHGGHSPETAGGVLDLTEAARKILGDQRGSNPSSGKTLQAELFERVNETNRRANLRFIRLMSLMFPSVMLISRFPFVIALWYGGILCHRRLGLPRRVRGIQQLPRDADLAYNSPRMGGEYIQARPVSLDRINALMDEKPEIADKLEPFR